MGTNVVKLTDRTYMKQLRDRIDEDYRQQLDARIRSREVSPDKIHNPPTIWNPQTVCQLAGTQM